MKQWLAMSREHEVRIFLLIAAAIFFVVPCFSLGAVAQEDPDTKREPEFKLTPERMGFATRTLESTTNGVVQYFLSTEGRPLDEKRKLPLVLFLQGSGPTPLFWGQGNRIGSSLMYEPRDFSGYHYAIISKPGVGFYEKEQRVSSKQYDQVLTLQWRVEAANAVLNQMADEEFVDKSRILLIGHSEGADVVPWVGAKNEHVTHVVGLAPGGVSQMFDFLLFSRKQVAAGEMSVAEGDVRIRRTKEAFKEIFADPKSTEKKWQGETYLRWSTFFEPSMEAWCEIEKPVFLAICRDDKNTPTECGEAIELEFIRRGKTNLTSTVMACDHYFVESTTTKDSPPSDRRMKTLKDILTWASK